MAVVMMTVVMMMMLMFVDNRHIQHRQLASVTEMKERQSTQ